jgi:hypothetical protein
MTTSDYAVFILYTFVFIFIVSIILFTTLYFSGSSSKSYEDGEGENISIGSGSGFTNPDSLNITKITNKIVTFSEPLKFEVVKSRGEINMFLSYGYTGSVNTIAQKRGIKLPIDESRDLDLTTFTLVDGSGVKFNGLIEGLQYYIQIVFTSSDPLIEDKGSTFDFTAPRRIQFGEGTTIQLPIDSSKGQMVWEWVAKDKNMIAKYRRVSSTIPWFGGNADFEDDILSLIPISSTYMLVKPGEFYYRLGDEQLVDAYDNETEVKDNISSPSLTFYVT